MDVTIPCGTTHLAGILEIPASPIGIVLFAHGSGSSRLSVRNQAVARTLQQGRIATLLFDLLTKDEEAVDNLTAELRFNIPLLAQRLVLATKWAVQKHPMNIGYFGASTGAAAALIAAAELGPRIHAVVSRGGRPDLAKEHLAKVTAPTLLIVGSLDTTVIALNQMAFDRLTCMKKLEIIEGASHLFEEKGKMDLVTKAALAWFTEHLS